MVFYFSTENFFKGISQDYWTLNVIIYIQPNLIYTAHCDVIVIQWYCTISIVSHVRSGTLTLTVMLSSIFLSWLHSPGLLCYDIWMFTMLSFLAICFLSNDTFLYVLNGKWYQNLSIKSWEIHRKNTPNKQLRTEHARRNQERSDVLQWLLRADGGNITWELVWKKCQSSGTEDVVPSVPFMLCADVSRVLRGQRKRDHFRPYWLTNSQFSNLLVQREREILKNKGGELQRKILECL